MTFLTLAEQIDRLRSSKSSTTATHTHTRTRTTVESFTADTL
jgi:hypothetical protein